jgi:preprotein translocase SecE subunit
MARFQQRNEDTPRPAEADLDSVLPPVGVDADSGAKPTLPDALPTLSSLSGQSTTGQAGLGDGVGDALITDKDRKRLEAEEKLMGAGLSKEQEESLLQFFKDVVTEFGIIEWPPFSRVIKVTIIVIATMIIASAGIYTVDGFFYNISQKLFEKNL